MEFADGHPPPEIEIRSVTALLRRQARIIIGSFLVVFALATTFLLSVTPTYTATALVLIEPDNQNILNPASSYSTSSGRDNARVDSEVEILKSDAVAMAVITSEKLNKDPEFGIRSGPAQILVRAIGIARAAPPKCPAHQHSDIAQIQSRHQHPTPRTDLPDHCFDHFEFTGQGRWFGQ
jgi:uncharacterized protein involved in exopolysaccharide biosynthesis